MIAEVTSMREKAWKPNPGKQELFLSLPDSIFEQFYGGAAGGGKSESLLMKPILRGWVDSPRFQALLIRRTYDELEKSLIERSKKGGYNIDGTEIPSFYDFGAKYNEQKKKWTFPEGGVIYFGHAEHEDDIRKYDTAEFQYIGFDELTSFTEFQYKFLAFSRCRSSIPGIAASVTSASNPGNIGHRWVRERFVEHAPTGGKIIAERLGGELIKRIFIQAFLHDNPKLMENDPLYKSRLEGLPEAERRAKLLGDWWTFSGQVFSEFRVKPFEDEPKHAYHVIPPTTPHSSLPRVLAIDWGYAAMTYGILGVPLPNKHSLIYKEYSTLDENGEPRKLSVPSWTTELANICLMEGIDPIVALDPSAWQDRGQGEIQAEFRETWKEVTGKYPRLRKANNDRIGGKMIIHDYLRWEERLQHIPEAVETYDPERADFILRNVGLDGHKAYLSRFVKQGPIVSENLPKLRITSDCPILIKTIPLCVYKEKGNLEDVKEFLGDDPYDDLRYYLMAVDSIGVDEVPVDYEIPNQIDINSFYRRMEFLEAQKKKTSSTPISIGRRRRKHVVN
jgi:hypothetical protein